MRKLIFGIIILFLIPLVFSMDECQRQEEPKDIPCSIYSTYFPAGGCNSNITIYSENGTFLTTKSWGNLSGVCNLTWTNTEPGTYIYNSTIENGAITIKAVDNMASLAITLFIMAINLALFAIPTYVKFNKNPVVDNITKKIVYLAGLLFLAFNTTIMVSIASNAGLGINAELFRYQWLFLWGLYLGMLLLIWDLIVSSVTMYKVEKTKKRMGEKDEEL